MNAASTTQIFRSKKFITIVLFGFSLIYFFKNRSFEKSLSQSVLQTNNTEAIITSRSHVPPRNIAASHTFTTSKPFSTNATSGDGLHGSLCPDTYPARQDHLTISQSMVSDGRKLFVVGDVHGCFDELQELLKMSNISCRTHLVILCGDVINKGPKSLETLRYIQSHKDCVFSVRGNHEQELNRFLNEGMPYSYNIESIKNLSTMDAKYKWATKLAKEDICFLSRLPYTINLPSFNVLIVHAGLKPEVPINNQSQTTMVFATTLETNFSNRSLGKQIKRHLNKSIPRQTWASLWTGPQLVIFGHDSSRGLQKHKFAIGLDTGCVYGKKLTGVEIAIADKNLTQRFTSVNSFEDYVKIKL
ncbi:hypothetical protein HELRODRAFT_187914 [Helobdella robusta]|uniref:Calcineurin-like phosphoesterase domain-containing protein n=1 Tax=Helobdella robusta TaxID=6412 RepID=T1FPG9_HELRO|nr:hypothetical protein HELRODRAFT_187914 [Helobdella robusta]ESO12573.1 hypothetical protein HELRODRAFT_187914 [Helobdella robusta]